MGGRRRINGRGKSRRGRRNIEKGDGGGGVGKNETNDR
jgi:hypothetical protein